MKAQINSIFRSIVVFVFCLFMGVTVGSIGVGAIYPPANLLAKPFVCPNGTMSYQQKTYSSGPGTTVTQTTWTCVDNRSGAKTELGIFPMSLYAGLIYGFVLYGLVLIVLLFRRLRQMTRAQADQTHPRRQTAATGDVNDSRRTNHPAAAQPNALARMQRLKELRAANMISETEYQQKRAEILKDV